VPSLRRSFGVAASAVLVVASLGACGTFTVTHNPRPAGAGARVPSDAPDGLVTPAVHAVALPPVAPALAAAGRWAVGDSVMLGARPQLVTEGVRVDAVESRQFHTGIVVVRAARDAGALPRNVIVHLGTNGTATLADCRAIVTAAGASRRVFLVTVHGPRPWMRSDNVQLSECAAAYPDRRVVLVNWDRAASHHPEWFYRDGIHLNGTGRAAYAALVTRVVSAFAL
jgi:hypothetical protein